MADRVGIQAARVLMISLGAALAFVAFTQAVLSAAYLIAHGLGSFNYDLYSIGVLTTVAIEAFLGFLLIATAVYLKPKSSSST